MIVNLGEREYLQIKQQWTEFKISKYKQSFKQVNIIVFIKVLFYNNSIVINNNRL